MGNDARSDVRDLSRSPAGEFAKEHFFVQTQNRWKAGDNVRLELHVYKPLKRVEIETVKNLVREMLDDYPVEFAFLDVSHYHPFQIFDPNQDGVLVLWGEEKQQ